MPTTSIHFLAPLEIYKTQKPYSLRFGPDDPGIPKTNVKLERRNNANIEDIRGHEEKFNLSSDGFGIMDFRTSLNYDDFEDEQKIVNVYLREVADAVREFTGAGFVQIFEYTVRRRHPEFPIATGGTYRWNQPTATAHIDSTINWIKELIAKMNTEKESKNLLRKRFMCVNIWVPLKGPVRDWPLAMCHPKSINPSTDVEPADLVYPRYNIETCQLYWSPKHEWYYLSNQQPNEALVFIQSESCSDSALAVLHSSFPMPEPEGEWEPRESIETRAILFYEEE